MSPAASTRPPSTPARVVPVPAGAAGLAVMRGVVAAALAGREVSALLPAYARPAMVQRIAEEFTARPEVPWPADAAVVCPTSGSTGAPRAVVLTTANLRASAAATHSHGSGPPPAWFSCLPPATVASLMCVVRAAESGSMTGIWSGAGAGRPFTVAEFRADAEEFRTRVRTELGASTPIRMVLVPTQAARLFTDPSVADTLAHFDTVVVGGGPISAHLERMAQDTAVHLVRSYGLTETCGGVVHDGRPLPGVSVRVVDGELTVGGPMVADTYTDAPLPRVDGHFRTGDRATIAADGTVTISGRIDEVVAIKGSNVDRAAVARVLSGVSGVRDCAVVALPHPIDGHHLVAYLVGTASAEVLRTAAAAELGSVAVPEIRRVPELPLLPGGKVDLTALTAAEPTTTRACT